jgi:DNA-binding transcriptional MocR family regulator
MGTRIGWVYAGPFSDAIQHLQLMSTLSARPLIQNALVDFLSLHLKQKLPASCHVDYYPSGYFLWITLPELTDSLRLVLRQACCLCRKTAGRTF